VAGWSEERARSGQLGRRRFSKPEANERRPAGGDAEQYGLPNHQRIRRRWVGGTRGERRQCCRLPS